MDDVVIARSLTSPDAAGSWLGRHWPGAAEAGTVSVSMSCPPAVPRGFWPGRMVLLGGDG
jgi:hypothetical protein